MSFDNPFAAFMNPIDRGGTAGHFYFELDGCKIGYCKSVEGGFYKGNTIEEQPGSHLEFIKHISTLEIDPISVELGMAQAFRALRWVKDSWTGDELGLRLNGFIRHANFDYKTTFQQSFEGALITEVAFPTLDSSSKEAAYLKIKFQPEAISLQDGDKAAITDQSPGASMGKRWNASCFRFTLDNIGQIPISKIDSFTVKQGVKALYYGGQRLPEWEPTKLTFPDVSIHMTEIYAKQVFEWYQDVLKPDGAKSGVESETNGCIEYLDLDRDKVLFKINLNQVGIKAYSIDKSEANQEQMKRVKFDLYCANMGIGGDGASALDAE